MQVVGDHQPCVWAHQCQQRVGTHWRSQATAREKALWCLFVSHQYFCRLRLGFSTLELCCSFPTQNLAEELVLRHVCAPQIACSWCQLDLKASGQAAVHVATGHSVNPGCRLEWSELRQQGVPQLFEHLYLAHRLAQYRHWVAHLLEERLLLLSSFDLLDHPMHGVQMQRSHLLCLQNGRWKSGKETLRFQATEEPLQLL